MNDVSLTQLKAVVDQAVRPVRATLARKKRMREELLAHLVSVFEQELERTGDQQAALGEAARRFGDPGELTRQLQQAVPRWNRRRSVLENMGGRPDESAWHLAGKHFVVTFAIYAVVAIAALVVLLTFIATRDGYNMGVLMLEEYQGHWLGIVIAQAMVLVLFNVPLSLGFAWLLKKIGPFLANKRWGRNLLAGSCILMLPLICSGLGAAAAIFILMVRQATQEQRCQTAWAC